MAPVREYAALPRVLVQTTMKIGPVILFLDITHSSWENIPWK